jgi:hypothetical protein
MRAEPKDIDHVLEADVLSKMLAIMGGAPTIAVTLAMVAGVMRVRYGVITPSKVRGRGRCSAGT